jgi:hypothetical protein
MKWITKVIIDDLNIIFKQKGLPVEIEMQNPGGDYDTCAVVVKPLNQPDDDTNDDAVTACGFDTANTIESEEEAENPSHDIPYVEIRNNYSDSDGGLGQNANEPIQQAYLTVMNYFRKFPVQIIRHYNQIF